MRQALKRAGLAITATMVAAAFSGAPANAFSCSSTFSRVPTPNPGHAYNNLVDVDATSEAGAWAVGFQRTKETGPDHTLIEHFSNGTWKAVSSPNGSKGTTELYGVSIASNRSVYAVGENYHGSFNRSVIEHRTKKKTKIMGGPQPGTQSALNAVDVVSPSDIWAVGWAKNSGNLNSLVEHWDGANWSQVSAPSPSATLNILEGVTAISATDIWAVGYDDVGGVDKTLTMHYDGFSWTVVASPNVGIIDNRLQSVSAASTGDVMAVGYQENTSFFATLALHWTGASWAVVPTTNPGSSENNLRDVSMASATDGYAVGERDNGKTLMEHWNGASWSDVTTPNPGNSYNALGGTVALSSGFYWAVGDEGSPFHTVALVRCV